jgi:hypothetical protein
MMSIWQVQKWCRGFADGQVNVVEDDRSGRLSTSNTFVNHVNGMLEADRRVAKTIRAGIQPFKQQCLGLVNEELGWNEVCSILGTKTPVQPKEDWQNRHVTDQSPMFRS